jgi:hypothetical protein
VIRDVEPGQVVAGNPARPIRARGQFMPPALEQLVAAGWHELAGAVDTPSEAYR